MTRYLVYAASVLGGLSLMAGVAQAQTFLSASQIISIIGPIATQVQVQNVLDQVQAGMPISQIGTSLSLTIKCDILANMGSPIPNFSTECAQVNPPPPPPSGGGGGSSGGGGAPGPIVGASTSGTLGACAVAGGNSLTGTVTSGNTLTGTVTGSSTLSGTVVANSLSGSVVSGAPCIPSPGPGAGGGAGIPSSGPPISPGGGVLGTSTGPSIPPTSVPPPPGEVQGVSTGPLIPNAGAGGDWALTLVALVLAGLASVAGIAAWRRLA